jgi:predicted chitinase
LGRGSAATEKDPLPANAAHWRKIKTPEGERWADLNAAGTFKFSDADFPAFLGWNCFGDDTKIADQRCDSLKLKVLLTSEIDNADAKLAALSDPLLMFAYARKDSIKEKLRKAICKFPTEFDQGDFEARYGSIKDEEYFKTDATGKNWDTLCKHIKALTVTDLPDAYKQAQWHLHPLAFIEIMRKCGWLSKSELKQMIPNRAIRHQKVTANGAIENRYHWEPVSVNENMLSAQQPHLDRMLRKFGITTASRMACFLGNAIQETAWLGTLEERGGANLWYGKWHGRGLLQLTFPSNYFTYWRWLGRTVPETLAAALDHAVATARIAGNNSALRDGNFPGLTAQMIDWRDDIQSNLKGHAAQSAGFYWAKLAMARYADKPHALERREVSIYQHAGQTEVYYRSSAFWQASAAVNLPAAVGSLYSKSLNGFADRCCAYAQVLMVASDMAFPKVDGSVSLWPESLTTRRG